LLIKNLKSLRILNLNNNNLSTLPESLTQLDNLSKISIRGNHFSDFPVVLNTLIEKGVQIEMDASFKLKWIKGYSEEIIQSIKDLESIIRNPLKIKEDHCYEKSLLKIIADKIVGIELYEEDIHIIPESITIFKDIEIIILKIKNLEKIPESLFDLKHLKCIYLKNNNISSIPESLGDSKSLETLYIKNCKLTKLPESICNLISLKKLILSKNQIIILPESIGNLESLEYLALNNNKLKYLPKSITNLKLLKKIEIKNNPISLRKKKTMKTILTQLKNKKVIIEKK